MKGQKELSFTQYERTCPDHTATEDRHCYCGRTDEMCNKTSCWKFREKEND